MIDAQTLTRRMGGTWRGHYANLPCPVCQPERRTDQRGLALRDGVSGQILAACFKSGCTFRDIMQAVGVAPGPVERDPDSRRRAEAKREAAAEARSTQARRLWQESQSIEGTAAECYLRRRGITCDLPSTLRFNAGCWHASGRRLPALVSLVEGAAGFATHRTYLRRDGTGKAAVMPDKAMLGSTQGGSVRISDGVGRLVVAEGIETALSLLCGLLEGPATVWATLSTSGMRALRLPPKPGRLTIAADGDRPGREAALSLAERASALGWSVALLSAPVGNDWNDVLQGRATA